MVTLDQTIGRHVPARENISPLAKVCLGSLVFITFFLTHSHAQDISFEATVNTNKVSLGSILQLTLSFNGAQNVPAPELPTVDGFEARYLGPSTRISIVNGQYSSSVAHIYNLFPLKGGKFQIPPIRVEVSGKTYASEPIDVEVVDTPVSPSFADEESPPESVSLKDKIFLTIEVPKRRAYWNEKIPVTIKLFVSGLSVRDIQYPEFKPTGFTVEEFSKPNQYSQTVGGVLYDVIEFNTFIYPTRTGQLTLEPAKLSCSVLYRSSQRRSPFDSFDSFFDDFLDQDFGGFFGGLEKRPLLLQSVDVTVDILPLPQEGKPKDFSGAVGQFDFTVQASPLQVKLGDPVTLKMTVEGDENLKAITMPAVAASDDFKVYDPQIKEEDGKKILEQVLIPRSEKATEIPAVVFHYFDPQSQSYQTIIQGPLALEVTKPSQEESFKVVESLSAKGVSAPVEEVLGHDIIFIKERPARFQPRGYRLYRSGQLLIFVVISTLVFALLLVFHYQTHRLKTDIVYARRLRAPKKAKQGLAQARRFLQEGKQKEFYDALFKTLQDYLGDKFHLSAGAVTVETITHILNSGRQEALRDKIKSVFAECEMVRYASLVQEKGTMKESFSQTQEIIDSLERS